MADIQDIVIRVIVDTQQANRELGNLAKTSGGLGPMLTGIWAGIGFAMANAIIKPMRMAFDSVKSMVHDSIGEFIKYEKMLMEVQSMGMKNMEMADEIAKNIAMKYGFDPTDILVGIREAIGGGISEAQIAALMGTSAKLSVAGGMSDVQAVTKMMISLTNAYDLGAEGAEHFADVIMEAQQQGIFFLKEVVESLPRIIPLAKQVGVSFEEMMATLTFMTKQGQPFTEAVTYYRQMLASLLQNNLQQRKSVEVNNKAIADDTEKFKKRIAELKDDIAELGEKANKRTEQESLRHIDAMKEISTQSMAASFGGDIGKYFEEIEKITGAETDMRQFYDMMYEGATAQEAALKMLEEAQKGAFEGGRETVNEYVSNFSEKSPELMAKMRELQDVEDEYRRHSEASQEEFFGRTQRGFEYSFDIMDKMAEEGSTKVIELMSESGRIVDQINGRVMGAIAASVIAGDVYHNIHTMMQDMANETGTAAKMADINMESAYKRVEKFKSMMKVFRLEIGKAMTEPMKHFADMLTAWFTTGGNDGIIPYDELKKWSKDFVDKIGGWFEEYSAGKISLAQVVRNFVTQLAKDMEQVWAFIQETGAPAIIGDAIATLFGTVLTKIGPQLVKIGGDMAAAFIGGIVKYLTSFGMKDLFDAMNAIQTWVFEKLISFFNTIKGWVDKFTNLLRTFFGYIKSIFSEADELIGITSGYSMYDTATGLGANVQGPGGGMIWEPSSGQGSIYDLPGNPSRWWNQGQSRGGVNINISGYTKSPVELAAEVARRVGRFGVGQTYMQGVAA